MIKKSINSWSLFGYFLVTFRSQKIDFIRFYQISLDFIRLYQTLLDFIRFYQILLDFIRFYLGGGPRAPCNQKNGGPGGDIKNHKKMGGLAVIKILYKKSVDLLTDSDFVRGEGFWGSPPGPIFSVMWFPVAAPHPPYNIIRFYQILLDFIRFYQILLDFSRFF